MSLHAGCMKRLSRGSGATSLRPTSTSTSWPIAPSVVAVDDAGLDGHTLEQPSQRRRHLAAVEPDERVGAQHDGIRRIERAGGAGGRGDRVCGGRHRGASCSCPRSTPGPARAAIVPTERTWAAGLCGEPRRRPRLCGPHSRGSQVGSGRPWAAAQPGLSVTGHSHSATQGERRWASRPETRTPGRRGSGRLHNGSTRSHLTAAIRRPDPPLPPQRLLDKRGHPTHPPVRARQPSPRAPGRATRPRAEHRRPRADGEGLTPRASLGGHGTTNPHTLRPLRCG